MRRPTTLLLALAVLTAALWGGPAGALPRPKIELFGDDLGTFALDGEGTAHVVGTVEGRPFGGPYVATLRADDGTLPDPGVCEPGVATLDVDGPHRKRLLLVSAGDVCGEHVIAPWVVTHRFTGVYEVERARPREVRRRLLGTDGFLEVILAVDGTGTVFAIDT